MKKLAQTISAMALVALMSGCVGYGTITRNLSKDGAIVQIELSSPWGPQKFTRVGVTTNKNTVLVEPGGRVVMNPPTQQQEGIVIPLSALAKLGAQGTNSAPTPAQ
ncbi:MAG TPA: hypothetical protein VF773_12010 [Verrucomicrobiae bacterium]